MKYNKQRRCFFTSFFMTLLVCSFLTACVIVDRNTRKIGFGEETPVISFLNGQSGTYGVTVNVFGRNFTIDLMR